MYIRSYLVLLFCCFAHKSIAEFSPVKTDSIVHYMQVKNQLAQDRSLTYYLNVYFEAIPIDSFNSDKVKIDKNLLKYNLENIAAFEFFIESIGHNRLLQTNEAKSDLLKAIEIAAKNNDHYLLYTFLSHLAFIQTYEGNAIEAISSFAGAQKQAVILNDAYLQVIVDVNISDIYYRYGFYSQSLYYLDEARAAMALNKIRKPRLANVILYNKSENYFRMNKLDSLEKYNSELISSKDKGYKLYTYVKRTNYYLHLLNHDYESAINLILSLQKDTSYKFETLDKQNLADAYFNAGKQDSAKYIIGQILTEKELNNHPEIKYHLYEILGEISEKENNNKEAADNFNLALQQAKDNVSKLVQVGDISSQMKINEIESSYIQQDEIYKRERMWLTFSVIIALFTLAVILMFYRNIRQKRHYEKLLFAAKKEELANINSHDIRRHLTNILGIIDLVKQSENKAKEYSQVEESLFYSAEQLDEAIKDISRKLDD